MSGFKESLGSKELPGRGRVGWLLNHVSNMSVGRLIAWGVGVYVTIVLFFSLIEIGFLVSGSPLVVDGDGNPANWLEIIYFNFVTILTVGYGDFAPVGFARFLSIIEALLGVALFATLVSVVAVKALSAPTNSVVFSKYAYYCTRLERFMIIYLNTTNRALIHCELSSYFKQLGDWGVTQSIVAPFVTNSVQTFLIQHYPASDLQMGLQSGDCLRVGLSGQLGMARYSTAVQYDIEQIIVIPDREELIRYDGFWQPDMTNEAFRKMFHYRPLGAPTLAEHISGQHG